MTIYNPIHSCEKCGSLEQSQKYKVEWYSGVPYKSFVEWIEITCQDCGNQWYEDCFDWPEKGWAK